MARLRAGGWLVALGLFLATAMFFLRGVFVPEQTLSSNDGPLGQLMAACHQLPGRFLGCWLDLNSVGFNGGAASLSVSYLLQWALGPLWFSKLYAVLSLAILGLGAWCFFRQMKLAPAACLLGGLAAMLNSTFFSVACWGVGAHDITAGMAFFALAALADTTAPQRWLRVLLAGMALGMAVTEGADVGAIFSVFVAAYLVYQAVVVEGPRMQSLAAGAGRLALVVICAAFLAAQSIQGLVATDISGVKGAQQDAQTKAQRWNWATQWSLPRLEMLNLAVPGLFGYRMDTHDERVYWGTIGQDPAWEIYYKNGKQGPAPISFIRYSGGGNYAGGLVMLVALWAAVQSFRRKNAVFEFSQRKWAWFWGAVAVGSLLLALGRFAPFYKFLYALPYFSTIRNPTKFLYIFSFALVTLFALGVDGLCRRYMPEGAKVATRWPGVQSWWRQAAKFDRAWVIGWGITLAAAALGWWFYAAHREDLIQYLQSAQISTPPEPVADFSIRHAAWFVIVLFLSGGLLLLIFSGAFAGPRAVQGWLFLAALLVCDLGLANQPWVKYWNYRDKYESNALIDLLREKPFEHRVALSPIDPTSQFVALSKMYRFEWMQQQFPYYNIQSFDTVEMSRIPLDFSAFLATAGATNSVSSWFHLTRAWQLLSVGRILGPSGFGDFLARQSQVTQAPLKVATIFAIVRKPGVEVARGPDDVTASLSANGSYALFESPGALPRAKLFSRWEANTNGPAVLAELFDPGFDPLTTVLVSDELPASASAPANPPAGTVDFVRYEPKDIVLNAAATTPSVLLLTDHFDPSWKVFVDGHPETLLHCNYLMRGVYVAAGTHQVEFKFKPPTGFLWVSAAALGVTVAVLGILIIWVRRMPAPEPAAAPLAEPVRAEATQAKGKNNASSRKPSKAGGRGAAVKR